MRLLLGGPGVRRKVILALPPLREGFGQSHFLLGLGSSFVNRSGGSYLSDLLPGEVQAHGGSEASCRERGPCPDLPEQWPRAGALADGSLSCGFGSIASFCVVSALGPVGPESWTMVPPRLLEEACCLQTGQVIESALSGLGFICPLPAPQALRQRWKWEHNTSEDGQ